MKKKLLLIILIIVIVSIFMFLRSKNSIQGPVKTFIVMGTSFAFNPSTMTVDKGDTVKLIFKDDDGSHNLIIDGYNVSTKILNQGQEQEVTFVADKKGLFKMYCSLPGHEDNGMVGKLIVN